MRFPDGLPSAECLSTISSRRGGPFTTVSTVRNFDEIRLVVSSHSVDSTRLAATGEQPGLRLQVSSAVVAATQWFECPCDGSQCNAVQRQSPPGQRADPREPSRFPRVEGFPRATA